MDKPGYIFAELPDTPALREKAFACQGHGFKVCYGDGTIQVIFCRDCRDLLSLSDALNQNDDDVEAAIATSLEDPTDDELAKAIAASISDYQVARSVGASASSAAARESFEPVAGTIAPDELTNATAASIEGYPSPKTEVGKKITSATAVGASSSSSAAARETLEQPVAGTNGSPEDGSDEELTKALAASLYTR
jgi:hypothetical protein